MFPWSYKQTPKIVTLIGHSTTHRIRTVQGAFHHRLSIVVGKDPAYLFHSTTELITVGVWCLHWCLNLSNSPPSRPELYMYSTLTTIDSLTHSVTVQMFTISYVLYLPQCHVKGAQSNFECASTSVELDFKKFIFSPLFHLVSWTMSHSMLLFKEQKIDVPVSRERRGNLRSVCGN